MTIKLNNPRVKEALLQERINKKVKCLTCEKHCQIAKKKFQLWAKFLKG